MIVAFIDEIVAAFAHLAALLREGKISLPPAAAPRQGSSRPAAAPKSRTTRSPRQPQPTAAAIPARAPPPEPEQAEVPAAAPGPVRRAQSPWTKQAAWPAHHLPAPLAPARGPPIRFSGFTQPLPWRAYNVTLT
jgi:hypothetical protein